MRIRTYGPGEERTRALGEYVRARQAADQANEQVKKAEAQLIAILEEQELKSTSGEIDGVKYTSTSTSRTSTTFDEGGLKKALGARQFNKLTVAKLDRQKLEEAIQADQVDPAVVAQYTKITPGAMSIRLTKKAASDEADEA